MLKRLLMLHSPSMDSILRLTRYFLCFLLFLYFEQLFFLRFHSPMKTKKCSVVYKNFFYYLTQQIFCSFFSEKKTTTTFLCISYQVFASRNEKMSDCDTFKRSIFFSFGVGGKIFHRPKLNALSKIFHISHDQVSLISYQLLSLSLSLTFQCFCVPFRREDFFCVIFKGLIRLTAAIL